MSPARAVAVKRPRWSATVTVVVPRRRRTAQLCGFRRGGSVSLLVLTTSTTRVGARRRPRGLRPGRQRGEQ